MIDMAKYLLNNIHFIISKLKITFYTFKIRHAHVINSIWLGTKLIETNEIKDLALTTHVY